MKVDVGCRQRLQTLAVAAEPTVGTGHKVATHGTIDDSREDGLRHPSHQKTSKTIATAKITMLHIKPSALAAIFARVSSLGNIANLLGYLDIVILALAAS